MISWLDPQDWTRLERDPDAEAKRYEREEDEREAELDERDELKERL